MLLPFLYTLRALKVPVGTQEWLYLLDALSQDLAESSLDRFYHISRAILVKSESHYDAFDQAFLACFRGLEAKFDLKQELLDWLNRIVDPQDRPKLPEGLEKLDLEELRRRFLERLKEQTEEHHGGSHWIGTGGTSPFGHSGAHPSGIRIGGPGGGRSAMQVAEERRYRSYRHDRILDTRQLKVALKRLRRLDNQGIPDELNLEKTINATCKNAGDIDLVFEPPRKNQAELILLMDVGGSMDPYAHMMEALFSAAHASTHFKAFKHFYFHNCIYQKVYEDSYMREAISIQDLFRKYRSSFHLIIVGDACMNPYELFAPNGSIDYWENHREPGIECLRQIKNHYSSIIWLNPEPQEYWRGHPTIRAIGELIQMYPLSVTGLTKAVDDLRKGPVPVSPPFS